MQNYKILKKIASSRLKTNVLAFSLCGEGGEEGRGRGFFLGNRKLPGERIKKKKKTRGVVNIDKE